MKTKIKLEILFALLLIVLTACSNIEYSEQETHSDNYNQIVDLLNKQCLALKHESLDELTPLYAFAENTIEYGQLKNAASKKFDQTNTLECDYFIDKIEFKNNKKTAEAYLNIVYTERVEGHSKNFTLSVPNERGNDFIFGKIGGQWKFCPNGKCAGTKTEKYVCPEGELVNGKFECPVLYPSDISLKPLSECLNGLDDPQEILTSNIGPYKLQQKSITLVENSSVTKLTKQYSGDYMKYDDNKRLFSYAFYQAENDEAYIQIKEMFKGDAAKIATTVNSSKVTNLNFRDSQAIKLTTDHAPKEKKFSFITKRMYIAIPEHNAFMRFLFNDWVNLEDVDPIVRTYLNSVCERNV